MPKRSGLSGSNLVSTVPARVREHVSETKSQPDDGNNPHHVDEESDKTAQQCDRKDCHHRDV